MNKTISDKYKNFFLSFYLCLVVCFFLFVFCFIIYLFIHLFVNLIFFIVISSYIGSFRGVVGITHAGRECNAGSIPAEGVFFDIGIVMWHILLQTNRIVHLFIYLFICLIILLVHWIYIFWRKCVVDLKQSCCDLKHIVLLMYKFKLVWSCSEAS